MEKLYEILKVLVKLCVTSGNEKQFVFDFMIYDGSDGETGIINDTNVVQYEFVNLGSTVCVINDMVLLPVASNKEFHRIKLDIGFNEMDVTIYKYKFAGAPNFFINQVTVSDSVPSVDVPPEYLTNGMINTFDGPEDDRGRTYESQLYNKLLVISKVKADKKTSKPS